jgi:hypothetical protein
MSEAGQPRGGVVARSDRKGKFSGNQTKMGAALRRHPASQTRIFRRHAWAPFSHPPGAPLPLALTRQGPAPTTRL